MRRALHGSSSAGAYFLLNSIPFSENNINELRKTRYTAPVA